MSRGSLYDVLHACERPTMNQLIDIAIHMIEGLTSLHLSDPPIVHRGMRAVVYTHKLFGYVCVHVVDCVLLFMYVDIKSTNIFIGDGWYAKIG
jgi:hypothetical protein